MYYLKEDEEKFILENIGKVTKDVIINCLVLARLHDDSSLEDVSPKKILEIRQNYHQEFMRVWSNGKQS